MKNKLYLGDNLEILKKIKTQTVDLIYLDPPFNTKRTDFTDFKDSWKDSKDFIQFLKLRIVECKRVLKETGSIYLHVDSNEVHYLKIMMDEVFGRQNFRNHIVWKRVFSHKNSSTSFQDDIDHILFYTKTNKWTFNQQWERYEKREKEDFKEKRFNKKTGKIERYKKISLSGVLTTKRYYQFEDFKTPKSGWLYKKEKMEQLKKDGLIVYPENKDSLLNRVFWLSDFKGKKITNIWTDLNISSVAKERTGYDTQKPLKLLARIIKTSSNKGDLVLDCFMGSGTTLVSAKALKRDFIGIDKNPKAFEIATKRIEAIKS